MTSPLRYPGGKTRACKKLNEICNENFNMTAITTLISPFFGGGSFEFFLSKKYDLDVQGNDIFTPLYNFWVVTKNQSLKENLIEILTEHIDKIDKSIFQKYRSEIMDHDNDLQKAFMYFIINRCSFSGATLSGGYSKEASKKRFTPSSIERIRNLDLDRFQFSNMDFEDFLISKYESDALAFLDPPYYLNKNSKLYGNKGDMHYNFDHKRLNDYLKSNRHINWILTYNDCEFITDLYKDFKILKVHWSYGMNSSKKSSEIVIINVRV